MTDATHDFGAADDGFHEIHLSGKQLVFLFIATTIVSVLIFLLGVMVGRGVPTERQATDPFPDPTPAAAAAPPPSSPASPPPSGPDSAPPPAAEAPPPPAEETAPLPAPAEDLSYKKRLESTASTAESLKPRAPMPAPPKAPAAPPASQSSAQQAVAGSPQPGVWIVQVLALNNRGVANGIVQRLVGKGYPAFLVAAGPPTSTYKVQVGKFKDRNDAQRVVERLKKEEQFRPWITR